MPKLISGFAARCPEGAGRSGRRGSAMVAALCVVFVVAVLSLVYIQLSLAKNREHQGAIDVKRAFYLAEAGISESFAGLVAGKSGNVGSQVLPAKFGNGLFWVSAKPEDDEKITLKSTGLCGGGRCTISVVVERQDPSLASRGVFGERGVTIQDGSRIDSYDSSVGPYGGGGGGGPGVIGGPGGGGQPADARVSSNGDVTIQGTITASGASTRVFGDVRPGPGGSVFRTSGVTITGSTAPLNSAESLPTIRVPQITSSGNVTAASGNPTSVIPTGDSAYGQIRVASGGRASIAGPAILVVERLQVDRGGTFTIDATNGPVKIFVTQMLDFAPLSTVTTIAAKPKGIELLVTARTPVDRNGDGIPDPPVRIAATSSFTGTIYAPGADVSLASPFVVFGAIAARTLVLDPNARVHFDKALTRPSIEDGGMPTSLGWRLDELPKTRLVSLRYDPVQVLTLQGLTPPLSKNAHYDIGVAPPMTIADPNINQTQSVAY
jgi:hypothetical protein